MKVTFYSTNILARYISVFSYKLLQSSKKEDTDDLQLEYLYDHTLPTWDYLSIKDRKKISVICLGVGTYFIPYKDATIQLHIHKYTDPILSTQQGDFIYQYDLLLDTTKHETSLMLEFINEAKDSVEDQINQLGRNVNSTIRKYIYELDGNYGDWHILNVGKKRDIRSLFLPNKEKKELLQTVQTFLDENVKSEYERYGIPHKCNILLHGIPGSGKTSTIHCIASLANSDIGIIQFNRQMDDIHLTKAINSLTRLDNCKILVLEDIDSIFTDDRKAHDSSKNGVSLSGLLNFLDGLMRNEGIMVFITTNRKDVLDEAVFRSGRIDYELKYDYCNEDQIQQMLSFYFPEESTDLFSQFYQKIQHQQYTISDLQQYLFKYRKTPREILKNCKELVQQKETSRTKHSLYT